MSAFGAGWPKVTVGALLLVAPLGALTGRRVRAIRRACADANAINSELLSRLLLRISLSIQVGIFLGIVLLVAAKPGLWESIGIVEATVVVGLLSSLLASRWSGSLSISSTGFRN
jgi:hypothetical protein